MGDSERISGYFIARAYSWNFWYIRDRTHFRKCHSKCEYIREYDAIEILRVSGVRKHHALYGGSSNSMSWRQLMPCQEEEIDEKHSISIEIIEDEYFVRIEHEMTKSHYISFIAAVCVDKIHMIKLYPEGNAEVRFPIRGVRKILFCCNQDGLFGCNVKRKRT